MSALEVYIKTMNPNQTVLCLSPEATAHAGRPNLSRRLLVARRLAVCALLANSLGSARAEDALAAPEPASPPAQVQKSAYQPQGRQMERYKAFARQAELPAMTVATNVVLEVGGVAKLDVARLGLLSTQEKAALADQLGVPVGVVDKAVQRAAGTSSLDAGQLAQVLRIAVIDYRFLKQEWDGYHPATEGQQTKTTALEALQAGDISKAWELYDGLRRPAPPTNLRIVSGP